MCCPNRETGMKYEVGHIILHNTNERLSGEDVGSSSGSSQQDPTLKQPEVIGGC
jgi:hypothetical protein